MVEYNMCWTMWNVRLIWRVCTVHTWEHNKVRELASVCLPWQELVLTGQRVNHIYYLEVMKRLREKVRRKRPELFASNSWILHHDNAPAHTALSVRVFLATKQLCWNTLPIHRI